MAKRIGQIRYFKEGDTKNNYPSNINMLRLRTGAAFTQVYPIVQLGIQTLPGTKVYVNNHTTPVIIGATGIYELDVDGLTNITDIQFDDASLRTIAANPNAYIIIDYVYETE